MILPRPKANHRDLLGPTSTVGTIFGTRASDWLTSYIFGQQLQVNSWCPSKRILTFEHLIHSTCPPKSGLQLVVS